MQNYERIALVFQIEYKHTVIFFNDAALGKRILRS